MNKIFKVGLIGCGHISETYFRGHDYFNNFQIIKCADINLENAKKCAETYGIEACSVDDLLNDSEIEIILNLTIPRAHYEVAKNRLIMVSMFTVKNQWRLILMRVKNFLIIKFKRPYI